jgi:uncharacterized protein (DUF885 family)
VALLHSSAAELTFDAWVDAFSATWVRADPNEATTTQYFDGDEQDELDRQLTPITKEFRHARVELARRGLDELAKYDRAELSQPQRVSAAMLAWQLDTIIRGEEFEDFHLVFQQFSGLQVELVNFLTQTHPIRNRRDIQNYIVRLGLVAGQIDEGIAQAKERATRGFLAPDFIYKSTIAQFNGFLEGPPRDNVLVKTLAERSAKLSSVSAEDRDKFIAAAQKIVG